MIYWLSFIFAFIGVATNAFGNEKSLSFSLSPPEVIWAPGEYILNPSQEEETLHYDSDPDRGVNVRGITVYSGGVRHTAPESIKVIAVLFYLTDPADMAVVHIRDQGTELQPGPVIDSFRTNSAGQYVWKRANLPTPIIVPAGRDFWTTITVWHPLNNYPLTLDLGPMVPYRGGFISLPTISPNWYQLTDPPFWTDRNWNIRAVVNRLGGTGVREGDEEKGFFGLAMRVVPNPTKGLANVSYNLSGKEEATLRVYNVMGELVYWEKGNKGHFTINRPTGIYLLELEGNGYKEVKKLVVQR